MDSDQKCFDCLTTSNCSSICVDVFSDWQLQKYLDAPIPWIKIYIIMASGACFLGMLMDLVNGSRSKRFWFPCKYFSLNATSLALLAVATKLTVDLTSHKDYAEEFASVTSILLMSTAIGTFIVSMSSMETNEIILNVTALGILVVTIAVNLCIHYVQTTKALQVQPILNETITSTVFMLVMFLMLCFSTVVVPTTKTYMEMKYSEMNKTVSNEREGDVRKLTFNELKVILKKYSMMAETGSPQFVMARSVICVISSLICISSISILKEAYLRWGRRYSKGSNYSRFSKYSKYTLVIAYIQHMGILYGFITQVFRWYMAARPRRHRRSLKEEFEIETYWTQRLLEWKESSIPYHFLRQEWSRKVLYEAKRLLLNICILIQCLLILFGKLILRISSSLVYVADLLLGSAMKLLIHVLQLVWDDTIGSTSTSTVADSELDFSPYVLLLEGEPELPKETINSICIEVERLIDKGNTEWKSTDLVILLEKSRNFNGVKEYDNKEVKSLYCQQPPPNCWSLSVVTLTSIAMALPNISRHNITKLLAAVSEGFWFVELIEKTTDVNEELLSIRNAANVVWVKLDMHGKWLDEHIRAINAGDPTYKHKFEELSRKAENIMEDFKTTDTNNVLMENPLKWPDKVIAANSMYRICQTLLIIHGDGKLQTNDEMFESLSVMISNILLACLTNLSHTIILKCQTISIKDRVESVRDIAILLGKSKRVLNYLEQYWVLPNFDPGLLAYIDEWRAVLMEEDVENHSIFYSASSDLTTLSPESDGMTI